jgi:hypothetical protein
MKDYSIDFLHGDFYICNYNLLVVICNEFSKLSNRFEV